MALDEVKRLQSEGPSPEDVKAALEGELRSFENDQQVWCVDFKNQFHDTGCRSTSFRVMSTIWSLVNISSWLSVLLRRTTDTGLSAFQEPINLHCIQETCKRSFRQDICQIICSHSFQFSVPSSFGWDEADDPIQSIHIRKTQHVSNEFLESDPKTDVIRSYWHLPIPLESSLTSLVLCKVPQIMEEFKISLVGLE